MEGQVLNVLFVEHANLAPPFITQCVMHTDSVSVIHKKPVIRKFYGQKLLGYTRPMPLLPSNLLVCIKALSQMLSEALSPSLSNFLLFFFSRGTLMRHALL